MKALAIDLGGTLTKYCLIDENAAISRRGEIPSATVGVAQWVDSVKGIYERFAGDIQGVTLSLPGMLDSDKGDMRSSGAFIDLIGQNIFALLKPHIRHPLCIENDGKCGALAEVWRGALQEARDSAAIIIGTGLAGGLIKDRRLHRGAHFSAGEVSYMMMQPGDYSFTNLVCMQGGMMGLMMGVAQAKGIDIRQMQTTAALQREDISLGGAKDSAASQPPQAAPQAVIDGKTIFEWIDAGDQAVLPVYERFIQALALLAYNIQVVYDPELIAIGGGVSRQARLLPDIRRELDKIGAAITITSVPQVTLVPCQFLSDANLVGAMYNYLTRFAPQSVA